MQLDLKTRLAQLSELSSDDLGAFAAEIIDALGGLPEGADSAAAIGQLHALQSANEIVRGEFVRRDAAFAAEAVTASGARGSIVRRMAARQGQVTAGPETRQRSGRSRTALTATGALDGFSYGQEITDRYELADGLCRTLQRMDRHGPARGRVIVASAKVEYPEERKLSPDDPFGNARKMEAVTSPDALVATGGICLPVNVDYTVPTWATAERPLRDALPAFEATRGGLRFVIPPDIGALAGATGIWTEATDASPGAATKPVISMSCGTEQLVFVEAVSTRLGFGNMQGRFAPEQMAATVDLATSAAARIAENNLLNLLAAVCVSNVTAPVATTGLGATRDLISTLNQAAAAYRSAHRLSDTAVLTGVFPSWARDLIRVDMAREIGHAQDSSWNALMVSNEQIDELIGNAGVRAIWHLDGQPSGVSGGVAQTFGVQATGNILTFPSKMVFYLFPEGAIQFLDAGRLDLGVVRDSTLDATNDFEVMVETFEGLANRGFASGAIQYVAALCANGMSAGTAPMTGICA